MKNQDSSLIPFSAYMAYSLYGDFLHGQDRSIAKFLAEDKEARAYYASVHRVGSGGDFYTSVSASRFFGGAIASFILRRIESGQIKLPVRIVEIGADKGYLLGDVALFLEALSEGLIEQCEFISIEPLAPLREAQNTYFASSVFDTLSYHRPYACEVLLPPKENMDLCILSNELFDSVPCDVFYNEKILCVEFCDERWRMLWHNLATKKKSLNKQSRAMAQTLGIDLAGYTGVLPHWFKLIESLHTLIKNHRHGLFLSFDYGSWGISGEDILKTSPRFYAQHKVALLAEIFEQDLDMRELCGKADITYDVDFCLLDKLLGHIGLNLCFAKTQSRVLLEEMHLLKLLENYHAAQGFGAYLREVQKVKSLIHTMGERFMGICYEF